MRAPRHIPIKNDQTIIKMILACHDLVRVWVGQWNWVVIGWCESSIAPTVFRFDSLPERFATERFECSITPESPTYNRQWTTGCGAVAFAFVGCDPRFSQGAGIGLAIQQKPTKVPRGRALRCTHHSGEMLRSWCCGMKMSLCPTFSIPWPV